MKATWPLALAFCLSGCAFFPQEPLKPAGARRIPVNSATAVEAAMADYQKAQRLAKAKVALPTVVVNTTLGAVVEKYVPSDFKVFAQAGILTTPIAFDNQRPWAEALGDALAEVDIDMTADLERKQMSMRRARLTVSQVIEKYAPPDFSVYADGAVNMGMTMEMDRSLPWAEALGKGLATVGLQSTVNLRRKVVVVEAAPAGGSAAAHVAKSGSTQ